MITGATALEASQQFRGVVQIALSCVGRGVVGTSVVPPETDFYVTERLAGRTQPVTIKLRMRTLLIHDSSRHRDERWSVRPVGYAYSLDGPDGRELLAYHCRPSGLSHERRPHLHLGAGMECAASEWQKAHLLTGPLSPIAVLEPCLTVMGVPTRRPDWRDHFARLATAFDDAAMTPQS